VSAGAGSTVAGALADRPDLASGVARLFATVEDGRFDPDILDLCRTRVGTLLRCPNHAGPVPPRETLSERQRACLDFAELFVLDHHGITDRQAAELTAVLSDAEMVSFTTALALYDGFCRFELTLPRDRQPPGDLQPPRDRS